MSTCEHQGWDALPVTQPAPAGLALQWRLRPSSCFDSRNRHLITSILMQPLLQTASTPACNTAQSMGAVEWDQMVQIGLRHRPRCCRQARACGSSAPLSPFSKGPKREAAPALPFRPFCWTVSFTSCNFEITVAIEIVNRIFRQNASMTHVRAFTPQKRAQRWWTVLQYLLDVRALPVDP